MRFQFCCRLTYRVETWHEYHRPALEHLPLRWSKIDGKCSRKIALNFLPIPVMLNLTLALREIFNLVVRPLKLTLVIVFSIIFHVLCFYSKRNSSMGWLRKNFEFRFLSHLNNQVSIAILTLKSIEMRLNF